MLSTNLLPLQEKREIQLEENRRLLIFLTLLSCLVLIVGSLLLLPSYLPLVMERRGLEASLRIEEQASSELGIKKKIVSVKRVVSAVKAVKDYAVKPTSVSSTLGEFLQSSGAAIGISFLSVRHSGEFTLIGRAQTRRDLLNFEQRLRDSKKFEEFSSPLSNIVRETNINFSLQGKIKPASRF